MELFVEYKSLVSDNSIDLLLPFNKWSKSRGSIYRNLPTMWRLLAELFMKKMGKEIFLCFLNQHKQAWDQTSTTAIWDLSDSTVGNEIIMIMMKGFNAPTFVFLDWQIIWNQSFAYWPSPPKSHIEFPNNELLSLVYCLIQTPQKNSKSQNSPHLKWPP